MKNEDYKRKLYYIPVNIGEGTGWLGISTKRWVEGAITFVISLLLWRFIFFSFSPLIQFIAFMFIVVPLALIAIVGIRGESLFEFLLEWLVFLKKRRKMIFKIPRKEVEKKRFGRSK